MEADMQVMIYARSNLTYFFTCDAISTGYAGVERIFCSRMAPNAGMVYLATLSIWPLLFLAYFVILMGYNRLGGKKPFGIQHELNEYRTYVIGFYICVCDPSPFSRMLHGLQS